MRIKKELTQKNDSNDVLNMAYYIIKFRVKFYPV